MLWFGRFFLQLVQLYTQIVGNGGRKREQKNWVKNNNTLIWVEWTCRTHTDIAMPKFKRPLELNWWREKKFTTINKTFFFLQLLNHNLKCECQKVPGEKWLNMVKVYWTPSPICKEREKTEKKTTFNRFHKMCIGNWICKMNAAAAAHWKPFVHYVL